MTYNFKDFDEEYFNKLWDEMKKLEPIMSPSLREEVNRRVDEKIKEYIKEGKITKLKR